MKKILLLILTVAMLVCAVPHMAFAADPNTIEVEGLKYELNPDGPQKTATLTDGTSARYDVTIPATVSDGGTNYSVTTIGDDAFFNCGSLTSIEIPDSVTTIGDHAFLWCTKLTSIEIPNSVTTIGVNAFYACGSLTSIEIPYSVTTIGGDAFCDCYSLTSISVDKNNKNFESKDGVLFDKGCKKLILYPSGKTGDYKVPDSVTTIGDDAFCDCYSLTSISVDKNNKNFESKDGVLFDNGCKKLVLCPVGRKGNYTIPDGVITIGENAFRGCKNLTSVKIPDSVESIGNWAFLFCEKLTSLTIGNGVKTIGYSAFYECKNLTSLTIPDSVESIGDDAFFDCESLTSISVAEDNPNFKSKDGVLFDKNCTKLISYPGGRAGDYTIPGSVTTIGERAFLFCDRLTSVTIPNSVTAIGNRAFNGCKNLISITIPSDFDKKKFKDTSITVVENDKNVFISVSRRFDDFNVLGHFNYIFDNLTYKLDSETNEAVLIDGKSATGAVNIPDKVNYNGTEYSVKTIGDYAFSKCEGLTSVTIPRGVATVGEHAFYHCSNLVSLTIPSSVKSIGKGAFFWCGKLKSITIPGDFARAKFNGTNITVVNNNTFTNSGGGSGRFVLTND